jgi:Mg/Co/Ni transporter MgtE
MSQSQTIKDLMIDVFEFPHIPYWFTIRQAIEIVKKALMDSEKCYHPMAILVFDEKYNLLGTLTHIDLLKGIEPAFASLQPEVSGQEGSSSLPAMDWTTLFTHQSRSLAERPVSEVMAPARIFVHTEDQASKAAYLMASHKLVLLPVLDEGKKLVGLVRMPELFDVLSSSVVKP